VPGEPRMDVANAAASHAAESPTNSVLTGERPNFTAPNCTVTVLAVSPFDEDHVFLTHLFSHSNWRIHQARSYGEALSVLQHHPIAVVLCDAETADSGWKPMLAELERLPHSPLLIVTSRLADDSLWAEVLNLGGYDVLMKPFDRVEVLRVISLAWLHWKRQRERVARRAAG